MSDLDDYRELVDFGREIVDTDFELRRSRVIIRTEAWDGGDVGRGNMTLTETEIEPRPFVEHVDASVFRISRITPAYSASDGKIGGYTQAQLVPSQAVGARSFIRLIGEGGDVRDLRIEAAPTREPFGWTLVGTDLS
jgi:hypothetical protein